MSYTVRLAKPVVKALAGVDRPTERRIRRRLGELAENPYDPRVSKPLIEMEELRSSRVGG